VNKFDLICAPYTQLTDLPPAVKKLSVEKQKAWRSIWNNSFRYMMTKTSGNTKVSETYAFRCAWSGIRHVKSNLSMWEKLREKFQTKKLEIAEKQALLLDKLLKDKNNE